MVCAGRGNTLETEEEADYRIWQERIKRIEKAIAKNGYDLERLTKAGIERRAALRLLALAADGDNSLSLRVMRSRHAELKSLSRRMETIAREAKQVVNNPTSSLRFWAHLMGCRSALGVAAPESLTADVDVALALCALPVLADKLKEETRLFGRYLRTRTRTDEGIVLLLVRCWIFRVGIGHADHLLRQRGRLRPRMDCLEELARLLTDAFEAAGKDRIFSADGLRKTFRRHGPRVIRLWLDNLLARSNVESEQESVPVPSLLPALPPLGGKKSSSNQ